MKMHIVCLMSLSFNVFNRVPTCEGDDSSMIKMIKGIWHACLTMFDTVFRGHHVFCFYPPSQCTISQSKSCFLCQHLAVCPQDVVQPTRRRSWSCGDSWPELAISLSKKPGLIKGNRTKHEEDDQLAKAKNEEDDRVAKAKNEEDDQAAKAKQHDDGTCKPCVFFASSAGCTRSKCSYCHLSHTPPSGKRPKKQMREMNKAAVQKVFETVQESGFGSPRRNF